VTTRWFAYVVAAAVAVGAGTWALRLFAPEETAPPRTSTVQPDGSTASRTDKPDPQRGDLPRPTGAYLPPATPTGAPASTGDQFKLVGVVAPRESVAGSQWVALIAVNGEPARAFSIGAAVDGDTVLRDVSARGAVLGPREGNVAMALEVQPAPAAGMTQAPSSPGLESSDVPTGPPGRGSKYMILSPPAPPAPESSANNADDGHWRPPGGQ